VGYRNNDVYTAYLDKGKPSGLPDKPTHLPDDIAADLLSKCNGAPVIERTICVEPGKPVELDLPMNEHDVYFVTLRR
jgi:hypothetical protein